MKLFNINLNIQLLIWIIVGAITVSIDAILFIIMLNITHMLILSNFISGIFAISFNYVSNYKITFKSKESHQKNGIKYLLNLIFFWSLNTVLLKIWLTFLEYPLIAKLTLSAIQAPIGFITMRNFVFKLNK